MKPSLHRGALRQLGFLTLILVVSFVALEGLTRVLLPSTLDVPHQRVYPNGYYTWFPDQDFVYHNLPDVHPASASVRINADGLRGAPIPPDKEGGEIRVLVIGDSFTASVQLPEDQIFTTLLQQRLSSVEGDQRYRVINAGFNGVGTAEELLYFRFKGRALRPDFVVLQMTTNDLDDNISHGGFSVRRGHLIVADAINEPARWKAPLLSMRDALGNRSLLFYVAYRSAKNIVDAGRIAWSAPRGPEPTMAPATAPVRSGTEAPSTAVDTGADESSSAAVLLAEIAAELVDEANSDGVPVIILTLPQPLSLEADDPRFAKAKNILELRLSGSLNRVVDVRETLLDAHRRGENVYLANDGHLGVDGHRIVADVLARAVLDFAALEVPPVSD